MISLDLPLAYRGYRREDKNFILSTMIDSLHAKNKLFKFINLKEFHFQYFKILEMLLEQDHAYVDIACLDDDDRIIIGFCFNKKMLNLDDYIIHFIYVKKAWRNLGIAKRLIPPKVKYVTHLTDIGMKYLREHQELIYNPFLMG